MVVFLETGRMRLEIVRPRPAGPVASFKSTDGRIRHLRR